jgi:bacteriorhodopsin
MTIVMESTLMLTTGQYSLVYNMLSLTIAAMGAATVFFFLVRGSVLPKYRPALIVSGLVTLIACYHYFRIFNSWEGAYVLGAMGYGPSGQPFNDAYRYVDWLLTVPLLLVELVAVLALPVKLTRSLLTRLIIAAVIMIGTGYPGEISADPSTRWTWWAISMVPFLYIQYVLWVELSSSLDRQPASARGLISGARALIIISWAFYPIAFALPMLGSGTPDSSNVPLQIGYSIADIVAKVGLGLYVYFIARAKSADEDPTYASASH